MLSVKTVCPECRVVLQTLQRERDAAREETEALWKAMKQYVDASSAFNSEARRLHGEGATIRDACDSLRPLARAETATFSDLCRLVLEQEKA
jgi:hypothetical protein